MRLVRPRSDSHSPSAAQVQMKHLLPARERCYSLGGATLPNLPHYPRERQISCCSQTDDTDHDSIFGKLMWCVCASMLIEVNCNCK